MKNLHILLVSIMLCNIAEADMNIINNGNIVVHKVYSANAQTLVIQKSKKIYVCSVDGQNSKCILSKLEKNKFN